MNQSERTVPKKNEIDAFRFLRDLCGFIQGSSAPHGEGPCRQNLLKVVPNPTTILRQNRCVLGKIFWRNLSLVSLRELSCYAKIRHGKKVARIRTSGVGFPDGPQSDLLGWLDPSFLRGILAIRFSIRP